MKSVDSLKELIHSEIKQLADDHLLSLFVQNLFRNQTPVLLGDAQHLCSAFIWNYFHWKYRAKTDDTVSKM